MIILKVCERLTLCADEEDMKQAKKKIYIMFQNRTYEEGTYQCISDPTQRNLYSNLRKEFSDNYDEAIEEWERMANMFKGLPTAAQPTPMPSSEGQQAASKLEEMLVNVMAQHSVDEVVELAKPMLEKHIKETFGVLPQKIVIESPAGETEVQGTTHEKFEDVLKLVNLDIPVFLTGQAGTGKNVICKQVAEALNLDFYFTNAVTQEYQLKGFIDANGTYHETQFYKAFTQGGLFFLDEMDGSIPETLIILNSAIANRYFDFPTGKVDAHPDFRIISAGNTCGTGADIEYTGRFQLDASSLDRFALVQIDYSPKIEEAVSNNNEELCRFARAFRKITDECGIRCLFTYRSIERIAKLEDTFPLHEAIKISLTKGLKTDDLHIINKTFRDDGINNKYTEALRKIERK